MVSRSAICAWILAQNFYIVQYHVCLPSLHSAWVSDQQSVAVPQQQICPETYCCWCAWVNLQVVWPWPPGCSSYPCGGLHWKIHNKHLFDFFSNIPLRNFYFVTNYCTVNYWSRKGSGSFTLQEMDSGMDSDSNPIPVFGSKDWNLNLTPCSVKTSV